MSFPVASPELQRSRRYGWLPFLIVLMTVLAFGIGAVLLRYVERRLVWASGEQLTLAAAEVSDKLDRLLFERHGDVHMMARAFALRSSDRRYLDSYLTWMKTAYAPMYHSLGVTNQQGVMIAATEEALIGQNFRETEWFQAAHRTRRVVVGDIRSYEAEQGVETVAFTAPILDAEGTFLGVVTTRVALPVLEDVTTQIGRAHV